MDGNAADLATLCPHLNGDFIVINLKYALSFTGGINDVDRAIG